MKHEGNTDPTTKQVVKDACEKHQKFRKETLTPSELDDASMQMFRVYAIGAMIGDVKKTFIKQINRIMEGKFDQELIKESKSNVLCELLKKFDRMHAYNHRSVLEVELVGYNTISKLMDYFWGAITGRIDNNDLRSARKTPFSAYTYSRISENYRRVFEDKSNMMPIRYKELQLMTDMISGMTDSYAISLLAELKRHDGNYNN